jgi:hypothetical protein
VDVKLDLGGGRKVALGSGHSRGWKLASPSKFRP